MTDTDQQKRYIVEEKYYTAYCDECVWYGRERDNENAAHDDLTEHTEEHHHD